MDNHIEHAFQILCTIGFGAAIIAAASTIIKLANTILSLKLHFLFRHLF